MGEDGSRGRAMKMTSVSSIIRGRNTKRLRRPAQVELSSDVAAADDVLSYEDGADVKLEVGVFASSGLMSSFLPRPGEK